MNLMGNKMSVLKRIGIPIVEHCNLNCNEWTANRCVKPLYRYVINRIPEEFTKYYAVYYLNNKDSAVYPESLEELQYFRKNDMIQKIE